VSLDFNSAEIIIQKIPLFFICEYAVALLAISLKSTNFKNDEREN